MIVLAEVAILVAVPLRLVACGVVLWRVWKYGLRTTTERWLVAWIAATAVADAAIDFLEGRGAP